MSIFSDILSPITDFFAGERQQDYTRQNMEYSQGYNAQQAQLTREFQERMSNTAYQRATADMQAAGINPMLAFHQGGATTPPGATASSSALPGPKYNLAEAYNQSRAVSSAAQLQQAQTDKTRAEEALVKAQEENVRGQTTVIPVTIEKMKQDIQESVARIEELSSRMKVQTASAAELNARTDLLKAQLPQIKATIDHLNSMVRMNDAQITRWAEQNKLTEQEVKEAIQRVKQDLPEITAWLHRIEFDTKRAEFGARQSEWQIRGEDPTSWFHGILKAFNPLTGIIGIGVRK